MVAYNTTMHHQHAALGGTFDHLHRGHHHLLQTAYNTADRITIGLTTKPLYQHKALSSFIEPYQKRLHTLKAYLKKHHKLQHTDIIPLKDPYGPTLKQSSIDSLVVSQQTLPGAKKTNQMRQQHGLPPLPITVADLITDDADHYLSSTRIRLGLVDRTGFTYRQVLKRTHTLTTEQKQVLKTPQGPLVSHIKPEQLRSAPRVALVGDQTTDYFCKQQLPVNYAVIDHHINKKPHPFPKSELPNYPKLQSKNPAGTITKQTADTVHQLLQSNKGILEVEGEDDLVGVPLALLLPLKSLIFYGQRDRGLVKITVTEAYKQKMVTLLNKQP